MNHDESIAILVGAVAQEPACDRPTPDQRRRAEEHVSRCSDCWLVLSQLHERGTGELPPAMDRMRELFGCDRVQDIMYLAVDLSPSEIAGEHPHLVRHLGWCCACRDRFAEMLEVERAVAAGELDPSIVRATRPRWKEVVGTFGETIQELVGEAVVQLRKGAATFVLAPDGLFVSPGPVLASAWRGVPTTSEPVPPLALGSRAQLALGESGLVAELALQAQGADRVGLELTLSGVEQQPLSVSLRTTLGDHTELVASQTARIEKPVVFRGLLPGRYVLDIQQKARDLCFRLGFEVVSPSAGSG